MREGVMNYYTERSINDHLHGLPPSDIVSGVSFISAAFQIFLTSANLCLLIRQRFCYINKSF